MASELSFGFPKIRQLLLHLKYGSKSRVDSSSTEPLCFENTSIIPEAKLERALHRFYSGRIHSAMPKPDPYFRRAQPAMASGFASVWQPGRGLIISHEWKEDSPLSPSPRSHSNRRRRAILRQFADPLSCWHVDGSTATGQAVGQTDTPNEKAKMFLVLSSPGAG